MLILQVGATMSMQFLTWLNELRARLDKTDTELAVLQGRVIALEKECAEHAKHLVELIKPEKVKKYG